MNKLQPPALKTVFSIFLPPTCCSEEGNQYQLHKRFWVNTSLLSSREDWKLTLNQFPFHSPCQHYRKSCLFLSTVAKILWKNKLSYNAERRLSILWRASVECYFVSYSRSIKVTASKTFFIDVGYWSNEAFKCYCGSFFIHSELSLFYGITKEDDKIFALWF